MQTNTPRRRPPNYTKRPSGRRGSGYSRAAQSPDLRVLWGLIGLNVLVFVLWHSLGDAGARFMAQHFLVSSESVLSLRVWTLLTSAFSHLDATHLLVNLLALYVFGRPVAETLGPRAFAHLYVAGGLLASVGHVAYNLISGSATPALGASGAVMAIAVVFAALYPRATLLIGFILPIPAAVAVGLYILLDLFGVFGMGVGRAQIAHAAHLGGALYGLGYYYIAVRPKLTRRTR